MKALTFHGKRDVRIDNVPDPTIEEPTDAVIRVTSTGLCGSDLHLYEVLGPFIDEGDVLGHEPMGVVEAIGPEVTNLTVGDRVVVPFNISCGHCWMCAQGLQSQCETTQVREHDKGAMLFGYTKLYGQVPGGQAEYIRVPYADVGPIIVPNGLSDEQVLFLGDILPTGWQAAVQCDIQPADIVAIWGAGPVGQMAIKSAWLLGAGRVIAIDSVEERLRMAREKGLAETINYENEDVFDTLKTMTGGRGPDACIDAVGLEAHGVTLDA